MNKFSRADLESIRGKLPALIEGIALELIDELLNLWKDKYSFYFNIHIEVESAPKVQRKSRTALLRNAANKLKVADRALNEAFGHPGNTDFLYHITATLMIDRQVKNGGQKFIASEPGGMWPEVVEWQRLLHEFKTLSEIINKSVEASASRKKGRKEDNITKEAIRALGYIYIAVTGRKTTITKCETEGASEWESEWKRTGPWVDFVKEAMSLAWRECGDFPAHVEAIGADLGREMDALGAHFDALDKARFLLR